MMTWPPDPVPAMTVGQWITWVTRHLPRLVEGSNQDAVTRACAWLAGVCGVSFDDIVEVAASEFAEDERSLADLVEDLVSNQVHDMRAVDTALRIQSGVPDGWKMTKGTGCECALCSELAGDASDCLYVESDVNVVDRMTAALDIEMASKLWDKPLALYQIRRTQAHWEAMRFEHRRQHPPGDPRTSASIHERRSAITSRLKQKHRR